MKKIIICLSLLLAGCDSPMNHRVSSDGSGQNSEFLQKSFEKLPYRFELRWLNGPFGNITKKSNLMILVFNPQGELSSLENEYELNFYATMPSMGHPLEDPGHFEEIQKGIFINKSIIFNMPGDWLMELWITDKEFNIKDKSQWSEVL